MASWNMLLYVLPAHWYVPYGSEGTPLHFLHHIDLDGSAFLRVLQEQQEYTNLSEES